MPMRDLNISTKAGLAVLSDKWYALILLNLTSSASDFMQLRNAVRGISTFNLLLKLNELTELNLVTSTNDYHYQLTSGGGRFSANTISTHFMGQATVNAHTTR